MTPPPEPVRIVPVGVRCSLGWVEGYTEELDDAEILVQSLGGLPVLGELCEVRIDLSPTPVRGRARVAAVDAAAGTYRLALTHLDHNGRVLLAALLLKDPPEAPEE
jgi:hypothetical protein